MNRIMTKNNMLHYPLTVLQMEQLNQNSKVIIYTELNDISNINELFKDTDSLIILYLLESQFSGHYTTLFKNKDSKNNDIFNFFDPYGFSVDKQLDFLTQEQRKELDEKKNVLYKLLEPYDVIFNNIRFQGRGTQTCGQHVTYRLHNKGLSAQQYYDKFKKMNINNPDVFVANYVLNFFQKNNIS